MLLYNNLGFKAPVILGPLLAMSDLTSSLLVWSLSVSELSLLEVL